MQFLKTLFWALVAFLVALFAFRNWFDVTLNLWGDIQMDIKTPILLGAMFLIGFLPTFLVMRARVWGLKRRLQAAEHPATNTPVPAAPVEEEGPVI